MTDLAVTVENRVAVKFLQAVCGVRYWEDASVNDVEDEDGSRIPFRVGDAWRPLIDLDAGSVVDWPAGVTADVHFKVCDAGVYTLLDAEREAVREIGGYVPGMLSPGGRGDGDYVIMKIGADGRIVNWRTDLSYFE